MEERLAKSKLPLLSCFPFLPYTWLLVLMSLVDGLPLKQWRLVPRVQQVARYCLLYCLQEKNYIAYKRRTRRMNSLGFFLAYSRIRKTRRKRILLKMELSFFRSSSSWSWEEPLSFWTPWLAGWMEEILEWNHSLSFAYQRITTRMKAMLRFQVFLA